MKFNKRKGPKSFFKETGDSIRDLLKEHGHGPKKIQKKMPLKMLTGIRKKQNDVEKREKDFNIQSQILYNSHSNSKHNKGFVRDVQKEEELRKAREGQKQGNKSSKKNFEFRDGVLTINKRLLK